MLKFVRVVLTLLLFDLIIENNTTCTVSFRQNACPWAGPEGVQGVRKISSHVNSAHESMPFYVVFHQILHGCY